MCSLGAFFFFFLKSVSKGWRTGCLTPQCRLLSPVPGGLAGQQSLSDTHAHPGTKTHTLRVSSCISMITSGNITSTKWISITFLRLVMIYSNDLFYSCYNKSNTLVQRTFSLLRFPLTVKSVKITLDISLPQGENQHGLVQPHTVSKWPAQEDWGEGGCKNNRKAWATVTITWTFPRILSCPLEHTWPSSVPQRNSDQNL